MDDEGEVIREQMQDTREALTEKLEALEHQVVDTVQTAASSVAETVENVTGTVQGTVETVKETVEDAMMSVREMFDLRLQVRRHPWGMFLGAAAVGFIGTRLVQGASRSRGTARPALATGAPSGWSPSVQGMESQAREGPSLLGRLTSVYQDELGALKSLGVSAAAGLLRDMVARALPPELGSRVGEWMDSVTTKMGGKPMREPIFGAGQKAEEDGFDDFQQREEEADQPVRAQQPYQGRRTTGNGGHGRSRGRLSP